MIESFAAAGWPIEKPSASMFAWTPVPERFRHLGSLEFAKLLIEKADVAVAPGVGFGEHGDDYVRLALVENEQRIRQASDASSRPPTPPCDVVNTGVRYVHAADRLPFVPIFGKFFFIPDAKRTVEFVLVPRIRPHDLARPRAGQACDIPERPVPTADRLGFEAAPKWGGNG